MSATSTHLVAVPAGLFAPHRRPPFPLVDAIGEPVQVDGNWLADCPGEMVYVATQDAAAFRAYLRHALTDILETHAVPLPDRAWAIHRALVQELARLLGGSEPRPGALLDVLRSLAGFLRSHFEPDALFRALRVDAPASPVVRGVETAIGSMALAVADGVHGLDALTRVGTAAALADVGMLELPREVRERRETLTPMEWRAVQRHTELSARRLAEWGLVAPEVLRGVLHHHERWDGAGYPARLAGEETPRIARYVGIADAYSALTAIRRGRPRLSRGDALREMARSTGQFDPVLLRLLVSLLTGAGEAATAPDSAAA